MVVLDKLVFWPGPRIAKKPGEPLTASSDHAMTMQCSTVVGVQGWCTRGKGGAGHGALPSVTRGMGPGPSLPWF